MKHVIGSVFVKIAALLGGYVAAFWLARSMSESFDFFAGNLLGYRYGSFAPSFVVSVVLLLLCVALLGASIRFSQGKQTPWRNFAFSVIALCALYTIALCVVYAVRHLNSPLNFIPIQWRRLIFLTIAYTAGMALFMETLARLRDKSLRGTLYWPQFFRRYPIKRLPGFVMFSLLAGILLYLFVYTPLRLNFWGVIAALLLLLALSYFCSFVLSLSKKFEEANEEKLRAERFKAELITNVSHDIRTPLTSIISYVDLLKPLPIENAQFHEYVDVLERKSARLKTLISDLMEASKAGTGNLPVKPEELDLGEILGQIAGEFDDSFTCHELTLVLRLPEEPVLVRADAAHLWRVLENLFGNAAKYALPGTRVFAEVVQRDGHVSFMLKNTSQAPIDPDDDALLMEQFIRGDRARNTEGSGLGLYIAKSLMELMGGRLEIEANGDLFGAEVIWEN